jgi:hypothetical protein
LTGGKERDAGHSAYQVALTACEEARQMLDVSGPHVGDGLGVEAALRTVLRRARVSCMAERVEAYGGVGAWSGVAGVAHSYAATVPARPYCQSAAESAAGRRGDGGSSRWSWAFFMTFCLVGFWFGSLHLQQRRDGRIAFVHLGAGQDIHGAAHESCHRRSTHRGRFEVEAPAEVAIEGREKHVDLKHAVRRHRARDVLDAKGP